MSLMMNASILCFTLGHDVNDCFQGAPLSLNYNLLFALRICYLFSLFLNTILAVCFSKKSLSKFKLGGKKALINVHVIPSLLV